MVHPENKTTRPLPTGQNLNRAKRSGAGLARVETVTFKTGGEGKMSDQVDIKISEDLVRGIIETKVHAAISEALSSKSSVVEQVVTAALTMKVDRTGKISNYSHENKFDFLDILCRNVIQDAALAAVKKWATERQDVLEAQFQKALQTKKTSNRLVRACVDGLVDATKFSWSFQVVLPDP